MIIGTSMPLNIFIGQKILKNDNKVELDGKDTKWMVGQPAPKLPVLAAKCVIVEANERELDYIRTRFANLPIVKDELTKRMIWTGDDARFIVVNLVD